MIIVKTRLMIIEVTMGKYKVKFSFWIKTSPGSKDIWNLEKIFKIIPVIIMIIPIIMKILPIFIGRNFLFILFHYPDSCVFGVKTYNPFVYYLCCTTIFHVPELERFKNSLNKWKIEDGK